MKKVLLTNFSLTYYTGSELDTITMSNYFLEHNYEVSIFTIEYGYPLLNELDERVKLYDYNSIDDIDDHFDLIWSHHYPLLDYLIFKRKINADYIYYSSLSAYMGYEAFPVYYKELNYLSILSKEALDLAKEEGYDTKNVNLFTNYSFQSYFDQETNINGIIKKICVVSNHVPKELIDMVEIARSNGILVDIYGIGYNYTKINQKILSKYDLIISIGKTINYGLSLGIPCYCYDRFGGDCYITLNNIKKSYQYNFSGRYQQIKKSGKQIYQDIMNNYESVLKETNEMRLWALDNFCYEKMMDSVLKSIYNSKKFNLKRVLKRYSTEIRRAPLFLDVVGAKNQIIKKYEYPLEFCQIYYDDNGFSESNSSKIHYKRLNNNIYCIKVNIPNNVSKIRFDYSEKLFTKLNEIKVNNNSVFLDKLLNTISYDGGYLSINDDPGIILEVTPGELEIIVNMEFLDSSKVINSFMSDIHELRLCNQELEKNRIKNRLKSKLKSLLKK